MTSMLKEFRDFAMKGNVLDLAVGVIIGGAFGKIVTSLVNDVIMPSVGILLGKVDFSSLMLGPVSYGKFLQAIVDFLIVAFCIFMVIKQANRFKRPPPAPAKPEPTATEKTLIEIRDLLKEQKTV